MKIVTAIILSLMIVAPIAAISKPTKQQLDATFQTFVDEIKNSCEQIFGNDEGKFRSCAENKYTAMLAFFEKFFYYRDNKGVASKEFEIGTNCIEQHAPKVTEPGRKFAVERADWISVNRCYEKSLKTNK